MEDINLNKLGFGGIIMVKEKFVSVIIPIRNGEKTIKKCLDSVLNQTWKNYEVLVVENNSDDKTLEILNSFNDGKLKILEEKKVGRGAARRKGEVDSKGEIILMTDADCVVSKDWIEKMVGPLLSGDADAVQGGDYPLVENLWTLGYQKNKDKCFEKFDWKNYLGFIDTKNFAISREALEKVGFTNSSIISGNDTELSIRMFRGKIKVKFLRDVGAGHFHADSLKKVFLKQMRCGYWTRKISKIYFEFLKGTNFLERSSQTFSSYFLFFPMSVAKFFRDGLKQGLYSFIEGLGWRVGILKSFFSRGYFVECPFCGWKGSEFLSYNNRQNARCPRCGSFERHRADYFFLKELLPVGKRIKLLHFAPEGFLKKFFLSYSNIDYLGVDLKKGKAMKVEDITNLSFADDSFDIIYCSHVLEHVENDFLAMSELKRVLKKKGLAFIRVPLYKIKKTFEDFSVQTEEARKKFFGQKDHVRKYGKDFFLRLKSVGFEVREFGDLSLSPEIIMKNKIKEDRLFVCIK